MPQRRTTRERSWGSSRASVISAIAGATLGVAAVAVAATFSLTTKHLGGAPLVSPPLFPDSLVMANVTGPGHLAGRPDPGDTITIVFSQPLQETTICSGWSGTGTQSTIGDVFGNKAAAANGDDTITIGTVTATCSSGFHLGTIDMGGIGFFTGTTSADFNKSTIALGPASPQATIKITLGTNKGGTVGTVAAKVATLTPDSQLTNTSGTSVGSNLAATALVVQF